MTPLREYIREPALRAQLRSRLMGPWWRRRFHSFGTHSVLDRPAWLYGPHQIAIGDDVMILEGAWLAVEKPAWGRPAPVLSIGTGVGMRPNCAISASESIVIEDHVILATGCTVIDSDHTHQNPHDNVLYNPVETAPIRIGRGTWLGDRVSVLRGATIGKHCTIGANSVVRGEIPDYSVAVGAPARVVGSTRSDA
ncbi:MAG TPA: acyltransferase [Thermoleophilaceae bacterium]|jgi:acetyltransferase-like isoleucine patch superfamily enzyme